MYSCYYYCSVTQLCPTLCDPMDCSLLGSSVHGILKAWILGWVAISSTRASCRPRDLKHVSCIGRPGFHVLHYHQEFAQFMSTDSMMPSKYLILCCSLLLFSSVIQSCPHFCKPSITNSQSFLKLMSIESVMSSNHFSPVVTLSSWLQSSSIRVFSDESVFCMK